MTRSAADDIDQALAALATYGGDTALAAQHLKGEGRKLTAEHLDRLRAKHLHRYAELAETVVPAARARMVSEANERVETYSALEKELQEYVASGIASMTPAQAAVALKSVADAKAKNIDKVRTMRSDAPADADNRSLDEIIRSLVRRNVLAPIGASPESRRSALPPPPPAPLESD